MAEYEVRKLYDVATQLGEESGTYESMWAYYIRYPQAEYSTPGRFRIRITRMTAAEFMAMMGMDDDHSMPLGGYSIQGYIEKWSDKGWLQCIDWIGSPESSNDQIEQDLFTGLDGTQQKVAVRDGGDDDLEYVNLDIEGSRYKINRKLYLNLMKH